MKNLIREPLLQFLALGAVLFGVFSVIGKLNLEKPTQVVVTPERIAALNDSFRIDFKREPSAEDTEKLIRDYLREEIFVREAVKLDLHLEDQLVRLQLRKRMEDANSSVPVPTDQELEQFVQQHLDLFPGSTGQAVSPQQARNAWNTFKRREAIEAEYQKLAQHYTIVIERPKSPATASGSNSTQ